MVKGVGFSLTASLLFGVMYYYTSLLSPLSGEQIFGWRMLFTVPVMTLFVLIWGEWHQIREITRRLRRELGGSGGGGPVKEYCCAEHSLTGAAETE